MLDSAGWRLLSDKNNPTPSNTFTHQKSEDKNLTSQNVLDDENPSEHQVNCIMGCCQI
jgi:hypothetical protein